ncbi:hypothetical protein [Paraburkholderia sp. GAS334]|uniref:hypothetical protein n=1 Tax=Paraburkholderia sp. GAS334 TaxID=3035131 RepID=UPI003D1FB31D
MEKDQLESILLEKLARLAEEFVATLTIAEARSERDIEIAIKAIADDISDDGLSDDGLLTVWEMFLDDAVAFTDDPAKLEAALQTRLNPPLEVAEYALLVGLYLVRAGISRVIDNLPKQHLLAALLLSDAVEAQCYWKALRGPIRCRNPDPRLMRAERTLQRREGELLVRGEISESARRAANARHEKPGGSREKRETIRTIWASGKYTSRDICAEQECGALGMSYSTARRALRNTPDPI